MSTPSWERRSSAVVALLCALKALAHLALIARYDYHSDELYFLECGQRLALGYVDHPPLIPWIARLADASGGGIVALRLPAVLAGSATLYLGACLVREWGGQWRAQLITLLCLFLAPAPLRMTGMLDIPVIEVFLCTLTAYLVVRALKHDGRWVWGWAGAALGLAVLAKYSAVAWGLALFSGLLVSPQRHVLRARWPWLGVAVAVCVPLPNLVWQVQHGFPTLEFMSAMRAQLAVSQGRWLFLAGQVLYFAPLAVPVWIAGVAFGFRREGADARVFSVLFVALLIFVYFLWEAILPGQRLPPGARGRRSGARALARVPSLAATRPDRGHRDHRQRAGHAVSTRAAHPRVGRHLRRAVRLGGAADPAHRRHAPHVRIPSANRDRRGRLRRATRGGAPRHQRPRGELLAGCGFQSLPHGREPARSERAHDLLPLGV